MSRIFITGSADGLGKMAAQKLIREGHKLVLHARNEQRRKDISGEIPGAEAVFVADLSGIKATINLAGEVNKSGKFDAVIHNAAIGYRESNKILTEDGLPEVFAINSLAPYILTALIERPARLIYISSGLNRQGDGRLDDLLWEKRRWNGYQAYSDSKLHNLTFAQLLARRWSNVYVNSVDPGWVATKMGGKNAPDNLEKGYDTQCWLAISNDKQALQSGQHFYHRIAKAFNPIAADKEAQDLLLEKYTIISGINLSL
ncbi:MAG: SDR family NAD(P)-dependent oxidoreductase [Chitinophagaceae bacterium]